MPQGSAGTTGTDEMKAEDARKAWAALLSAAQWQGKHTVITRNGKRAGILVSPEWYDRASKLIAADDASNQAPTPGKP